MEVQEGQACGHRVAVAAWVDVYLIAVCECIASSVRSTETYITLGVIFCELSRRNKKSNNSDAAGVHATPQRIRPLAERSPAHFGP
jgi:hypothetical protein